MWQATNPDARNFRQDKIGNAYTSTPLTPSGPNTWVAKVPPPRERLDGVLCRTDVPERREVSVQRNDRHSRAAGHAAICGPQTAAAICRRAWFTVSLKRTHGNRRRSEETKIRRGLGRRAGGTPASSCLRSAAQRGPPAAASCYRLVIFFVSQQSFLCSYRPCFACASILRFFDSST